MRHIPPHLVAISVFANKLIGGKPGYSLCATFYANRRKRVARVLMYLSDKLFWWDSDHCRKAYHLRRKK